jgi:hemolysin activation/secretion protein
MKAQGVDTLAARIGMRARRFGLAALLLAGVPSVWAGSPPNPLIQQEQAQAARARIAARAAQLRRQERLGPRSDAWRAHALQKESPCFTLRHFRLVGSHLAAFAFVERYLRSYRGTCVGGGGLRRIASRAQDLILYRGFVTTRVWVAPQSVAGGMFTLTVAPGIIQAIRIERGRSLVHVAVDFPIRAGDVLNLRPFEQGIEQIRSVQGQNARLGIEPGTRPGESVVVLTVTREKPIDASLTVNDDGVPTTGEEQGTLGMTLNNLLGLEDSLSLSAGHSLAPTSGEFGSGNAALAETLGLGWWTVGISAGQTQYYETGYAPNQSFRSTGRSSNLSFQVSRTLYRNATSVLSAELALAARNAHNYVDGNEIAVEARHERSVRLGLAERIYQGAAVWTGSLAFEHGVPWFDGQTDSGIPGAQVPRFGYRRFTADLSLDAPLTARLSLSSALHAQYSLDPLYAEEDLSIAGPYTVRGFSGAGSASGQNGYYLRNTLDIAVPSVPAGDILYLGWDIGRVWGSDFGYAEGHEASGWAVGDRGGWGTHVQWDLSASRAIVVPTGVADEGWIVRGAVSLFL